PLRLQGPSFAIGREVGNDLVLPSKKVSERHALLVERDGRGYLKDLESTNGTYVNSRRIEAETKLLHGDVIRFGKIRFTFKNDLLPLERARPAIPVPFAVASGVAAALVAAVAILALTGRLPGLRERREAEEEEFAEGPRVEEQKKGLTTEDVEKEIAAAGSEIDSHWPERAIERLSRLASEPAAEARRAEIDRFLERARIFARPLGAFHDALAERQRVGRTLDVKTGGRFLELAGWEQSSVVYSEVEGPTLVEGKRTPWSSFTPGEVLDFLLAARIELTYPLETAAFALFQGNEETGRAILARYLADLPDRTALVNEIYVKFSLEKPPGGGWVLVGDRLGTRAEAEAFAAAEEARRQAEEDRKRAEMERMKAELAARAALEEARRAASEEFEPYLATVETYFLTYQFEAATLALEDYAERLRALGLDDLAAQVEDRLFDGRGEATLFAKLLDAINQGKLLKKPVWRTASQSYEAELADASREGVRVIIPKAEIRLRWRFIDPGTLRDFYTSILLSTADRYFLGKFCLDRGLENGARNEWLQVIRSGAPEFKPRIDRLLAGFLGIEVPAGGFVVYENQIVTPEEKAQLAKGLVLFEGKWMTREDRDRLKAGLVQYRGQWVTKPQYDELLKLEGEETYRAANEGFFREDGKWVYHFQKVIEGRLCMTVAGKYYPAEEARALRSQWDNAWQLKTDHYDLRTNMTDDFVLELGDFLEESWKAYAKYFGGEFSDRLEIWGFRTYDDYRRYCEETGNQSHLQAGGFAESRNDRGVGWNSGGGGKGLQSTLMHEGAHLYYFNVFPPHMMPSWYAEGEATQFEGYKWDPNTKALTLDYIARGRLPTLKSQILAGTAMKISDIVRGDALSSIQAGPAAGATFYASAWGLMYFIDHYPDPEFRKHAAEYKRKMDAGEYGFARGPAPPGEDPFEKAFGPDLEGLQKKFEEFIRDIQ
ncbi:MAG: FHA domain-containing protein, partial [Planctomycetes bacterium]|nr:FHA domain-containing protein [Planctomycetota bacterium]